MKLLTSLSKHGRSKSSSSSTSFLFPSENGVTGHHEPTSSRRTSKHSATTQEPQSPAQHILPHRLNTARSGRPVIQDLPESVHTITTKASLLTATHDEGLSSAKGLGLSSGKDLHASSRHVDPSAMQPKPCSRRHNIPRRHASEPIEFGEDMSSKDGGTTEDCLFERDSSATSVIDVLDLACKPARRPAQRQQSKARHQDARQDSQSNDRSSKVLPRKSSRNTFGLVSEADSPSPLLFPSSNATAPSVPLVTLSIPPTDFSAVAADLPDSLLDMDRADLRRKPLSLCTPCTPVTSVILQHADINSLTCGASALPVIRQSRLYEAGDRAAAVADAREKPHPFALDAFEMAVISYNQRISPGNHAMERQRKPEPRVEAKLGLRASKESRSSPRNPKSGFREQVSPRRRRTIPPAKADN